MLCHKHMSSKNDSLSLSLSQKHACCSAVVASLGGADL